MIVVQKGFTLIECLVYILAIGLLAHVLFVWVARTQLAINHHTTQQMKTVSMYAAQDLMARDISKAPCELKDWRVMSPISCIWHGPVMDIGWVLENKNLYRYEGHYNQQQKSWVVHAKSLVAEHVDSCKLNVIKHAKEERVAAVAIMLNGFGRYVALKNREVV